MIKQVFSVSILTAIALISVGFCFQDAEKKTELGQYEFTGEILAVLYVKDLQKSVVYYTDVLGFRFDHFYDHHSGGSTVEWTYEDSPLYAEMWAGPTRFALHLAKKDYEKRVGGSIHYFHVRDVNAHHKGVSDRGGKPNEIIDRPWMRMFLIEDLDGHRLFFQTPPKED